VSERIFGFSARGLWLGIASIVCTLLALWGPVGVTRMWLERFGAWAVGGICVAITILALTSDGIGDAIRAEGTGGFPTFGTALDLVIVMPVSWLPLVADYTRFATRSKGAFVGTFWGYLVANVWLYALGALLVLGQGATPDPAGIAGGILAVAGGSIAGMLFLVGLLAGETDEAFANIYSGAVSFQNIWPRVPRRWLSVAVAIIGTALAAQLTMTAYESFLFLIGSVFLPLFGAVAARYAFDPSSRGGGASNSRRGDLVGTFVAWLVGFGMYHWINPTGPAWWVDRIAKLVGTPVWERVEWLPASLPAFIAAFVLQAVLVAVTGRSGESRAQRELEPPAI
jgi:nucleobase:cation symporter-1, NCS1 family